MSGFPLFLAALLFVASAMFSWADQQSLRGNSLALDICYVGSAFCQNPSLMLVAGASVGIGYLLVRVARH